MANCSGRWRMPRGPTLLRRSRRSSFFINRAPRLVGLLRIGRALLLSSIAISHAASPTLARRTIFISVCGLPFLPIAGDGSALFVANCKTRLAYGLLLMGVREYTDQPS